MKTPTYLFLFISLTILSCRPMAYTTIRIPQKESVHLPSYVARIGVINRNLSSENTILSNSVTDLISGEIIGSDKEGAENAIMGFKKALEESNTYEVLMPEVNLGPNKAGIVPPDISQDVIHQICTNYNLDAIVCLESFDSDTRRINEFGEIAVKTNWKIYIDSTSAIFGEYFLKTAAGAYLESTNSGYQNFVTRTINNGNNMNSRYAINDIGYSEGMKMGARLVSYTKSVKRAYYRKGNQAFKRAAKEIEFGEWEKATAIWQKQLKKHRKKTVARAYFNLALSQERLGNADTAMQYIKNSYFIKSKRKAHNYKNTLQKTY